LSIRERLAQHRKDPGCASCHSVIDPLGFALENFDAIGGWRTIDESGKPVDASGSTMSGAKMEGLSGLRALLLEQPDQFPRTVTEKLLTYALGRRLDYYDRPAVRQIVRDAAASDFRWSSLILGIVKSPPFLMRNRDGVAARHAGPNGSALPGTPQLAGPKPFTGRIVVAEFAERQRREVQRVGVGPHAN
jgi:hypothetical protein